MIPRPWSLGCPVPPPGSPNLYNFPMQVGSFFEMMEPLQAEPCINVSVGFIFALVSETRQMEYQLKPLLQCIFCAMADAAEQA